MDKTKLRDEKGRYSVKHGLGGTEAYWTWRHMIERCEAKSGRDYKNYGLRGIVVCERWRENPAEFWKDMGPTWKKGLSLERIDNNGNYEPNNCTWENYTGQGRNKRNNVVIDTPKDKMLLCEAAEISGIRRETLSYRHRHGWAASKMFDKPDSSVTYFPTNSR